MCVCVRRIGRQQLKLLGREIDPLSGPTRLAPHQIKFEVRKSEQRRLTCIPGSMAAPEQHLDARSEFEVFQRFKELSDNRTAVLISHRFSSVRMADRILVLAGGRIEASGTHAELMTQGGRYAELFELQAAGYR